MRPYSFAVGMAVLLAAAFSGEHARAQSAREKAMSHLAAAKKAAGYEVSDLYDHLCARLLVGAQLPYGRIQRPDNERDPAKFREEPVKALIDQCGEEWAAQLMGRYAYRPRAGAPRDKGDIGGRKNGVLVMCEVMMPDGKTPHPSNSRASILDDPDAWFGFEQEYFLYKNGKPLENLKASDFVSASRANTWFGPVT